MLFMAYMAGLFIACGNTESRESGSAAGISEIVVIAPSLGPIQPGVPEVEAMINAITGPEIGVRIKYQMIEVGSYIDQLTLMMSSQEKADLVLTMPLGPISFMTMAAQNQLMDIGPLIDQYGQDLIMVTNKTIEGFTNATKVNGRRLGVTGFFDKVLNLYFLTREDLLEKHNISIDNINSLDDIEAVLAEFKAAEPNMSAILPSSTDAAIIEDGNAILFENSFDNPTTFDFLGDNRTRLSVAYLNDPYTIINYYKTPEFRRNIERVRKWYLDGYVYKDAPINTEMAEVLVTGNKGVSWFCGSERGVEANKTSQVGYPVKAHLIGSTPISTAVMTNFVWIVPVYSKEGAAAVKFLNKLYTDVRIANLLSWGIEGRDYEAMPDGTIDFPKGLDTLTVPYHQTDFLFNQYLSKVWVGNPPDIRLQALKENQNAPVSPLLGFTYDPAPVQAEVSAITNVITQYRPGLLSGSIDPAAGLPEFIRALEAAGAGKVIAEVQRQLDAWRAAN